MNNAANLFLYPGSAENSNSKKSPTSSSDVGYWSKLNDFTIREDMQESTRTDDDKSIENTDFIKHRTPLGFERMAVRNMLLYEKEVRKKYISELESKLVERFELYNYDQDSEDFFWPIVDQVKTLSLLGAAILSIIAKYNDHTNILCAIAKCLCSFELEQTEEWGPMVLISLMAHRNETVKEYAVFLLENWEDRTLLPILRNLDINSKWLNEYINSVITNLED